MIRIRNEENEAQRSESHDIPEKNHEPEVPKLVSGDTKSVENEPSAPLGSKLSETINAHEESKERAFDSQRTKPRAENDHRDPPDLAYDP